MVSKNKKFKAEDIFIPFCCLSIDMNGHTDKQPHQQILLLLCFLKKKQKCNKLQK